FQFSMLYIVQSDAVGIANFSLALNRNPLSATAIAGHIALNRQRFRVYLFVNLIHVAQFLVPNIPVGFDTLQADLTVQFGFLISNPNHATECFVAAALDSNNLSLFIYRS